MKLDRAKFRIYMDIILFIIISIISPLCMIIGMMSNDHIIRPAEFFTIIYLTNLLFYRICTEFECVSENKTKCRIIDSMSFLYILCIISSAVLIAYLIYFAGIKLLNETLKEIIVDHVLYSTIVGSSFIIHLVFDNTVTLYNLYFKK